MKIPVANVPNLAQAGFSQTASGNLLSDVGQAQQRTGGMLLQSAALIKGYQEKKQKLKQDSAVAQLQIEQSKAESDIRTFTLENPDAPEKWAEFQEERYAEVESGMSLEGLGDDGVQQIKSLHAKGFENSRSKWNGAGEIRTIENSNALIKQNADTLLRNGRREEAIAEYGKINVPNSEKIGLIENALTEGLYSDIQISIKSGSIENAEAELEKLTERGKDGNYTTYEDAMGGLGKKQRADLENLARSQIKNRKAAASKHVEKQAEQVMKGEAWERSPDMTEEQDVALTRLSESLTEGLGDTSDEFIALQNDIDTAELDFLGFEKDEDWFSEQWKKINGGEYNEDGDWVESGDQFNRTARNRLIRTMVEAESRNISDNEEDFENLFFSREVSTEEKGVRTTLGEIVKRDLAAMADSPLSTTLKPDDYGRAYQQVLRQIRNDSDNGLITPETYHSYMKETLPQHIQTHMGALKEQSALETLDEAFAF